MTTMIGTLSGTTTGEESAVLRALARAYEQDCHSRFAAIRTDKHGATVGLYGSFETGFYAVTVGACTCEAGRHGQMCKHRAALADRIGELDQLVPRFYQRYAEPGQTTPARPMATCPECLGDGYTRMYVGGGLSDWWACDCHRCGKTGRVAA